MPSDFLTQYSPNEFIRIMQEKAPLEDRLTALYVRALKPDVFELYRFQFEPAPPPGFLESLQTVKLLSSDQKSAGYKKLWEKYPGHMKVREEREQQNASNKAFLEEMLKHFQAVNAPLFAEKIKERLLEFEPCFS